MELDQPPTPPTPTRIVDQPRVFRERSYDPRRYDGRAGLRSASAQAAPSGRHRNPQQSLHPEIAQHRHAAHPQAGEIQHVQPSSCASVYADGDARPKPRADNPRSALEFRPANRCVPRYEDAVPWQASGDTNAPKQERPRMMQGRYALGNWHGGAET